MDREHRSLHRHPVRVVLLRDADQEPRRMDARLGREAHEASRSLAVGTRRDDDHRAVQFRHQSGKRVAPFLKAAPGRFLGLPALGPSKAKAIPKVVALTAKPMTAGLTA